jgi:hypothetical protein
MILFSLCHATARLPGWKEAAAQWLQKADFPSQLEYVLVTEKLDLGLEDLFLKVEPYNRYYTDCPGSRGGTDQWNKAAWVSRGKVLVKVADDFFPCDHWDTELLKVIPNLDEPWVVDVDNQDNAYPLIAHAILTRAYYDKFGYLEHPDYSHQMADTEFSDVARASGRVIDARHLKFQHLTPDAGVPMDDVYARFRGNAEALNRAREIYERRKAAGYPKESVMESVR